MKKIFTILMMIFLLLQASVSFAEDSLIDNEKADILDALGIIDKENESEYVTREEFFFGLLHLVYEDDEIYSVVEQSAALGLIDSSKEDHFEGARYITYNDAIAAGVTMLGYQNMSNGKVGYPKGYIKIASSLGLLSGVTEERTLSLKRSSVINLLYNMLSVEPFVMSNAGINKEYEIANGETLLSIKRNIYEISGLVTANEYTSLISTVGNYEKQITLNNKNYYVGNTDAGKYLGMYVKGYVQIEDDGEDGTAIYIVPKNKKNTILELKDEDILSVSEDCSKISYAKENTNREKNAKISGKVRVIYNNEFYNNYTAADFMPQQGNVRLIDNDGDSVYDCIFITSYETMVVDYTVANNYEVYGKYNYTNALNYLKLEDQDNNSNIHYYLGDKETSFENISKDDVLTVQRSKNSDDLIANIYISRETVTGAVNSFYKDNNAIKIDGEEYKVAKVFFCETDYSGMMDLSGRYIFFVDYLGEIVYIEKTNTTDYSLFYRIYEEDCGGEYSLIYMNDNSEWVTAPLKERVRYNGSTVKDSVVYSELNSCEPQVMLIKCNSLGEVNNVITAELGKKGDKPLTKKTEQNMRYRSAPAAFDCSLYVETDVKVFVIPENKSSKEDYGVYNRSYLHSDSYYDITAYDVDEFNFTGVISVVEPTTASNSAVGINLFVVTKVYTGLNDDDEPVTKVVGSMGSYSNIEYEVRENANTEKVSKGDVIRIGLDHKRRINSWIKVSGSTSTELWNQDVFTECLVIANDYVGGKLKVMRGTDEVNLRHSSLATILIYDSDRNTCDVGTVKDIVPDDKAYIHTSFAVPQQIVIVRD